MALDDLTGKNIQDTYQRVVQTDGNTFADGTGSALQIITSDQTGSMSVATASYAISASHEITYELSSSHAETADALTPGIDIDVRNMTSSGNLDVRFNISQSRGKLTTNEIELLTSNPLHVGIGQGIPIQTKYLQITNPNDGPVTEAGLRAKVTIFGEEFNIPEVEEPVYGLHVTNQGIKLDGAEGHISASGNIENKGSLKVHGNITASGNISSSGKIIANAFIGAIDGGSF
jgi:hypothetical protein